MRNAMRWKLALTVLYTSSHEREDQQQQQQQSRAAVAAHVSVAEGVERTVR
jgi:hypothetical protein